MNIRKNKKFLTASLLGATVLTVAGIGFSAWIVGLNRTSVNLENIPVTIDAVNSKTVLLEANLTESSISLGASEIDGNGVLTGDQNSNEDLSVHLEGRLIVANEMTNKVKEITLSMTASNGGETGTDTNSFETSASDVFGRAAGTYTYLNLATSSISISSFSDYESADSGYKVFNINTDLTFTYGSFFDDGVESTVNNPINFYNSKLSDLKNDFTSETITSDAYLDAISLAKTQITNMNNAIKKLILKVEAKVSK